MKLATTTGDFSRYTCDQGEIVRYIHQAGFKYADYSKKRDRGDRLIHVPLSVRIKAEEMLYEIDKATLEAYNCFEE